LKVSKIPYTPGSLSPFVAYHDTVPGSPFAKTALCFRNAAISDSLPGWLSTQQATRT
jgi:hypothetical protein